MLAVAIIGAAATVLSIRYARLANTQSDAWRQKVQAKETLEQAELVTFHLTRVSSGSRVGLRFVNGSSGTITQLHLADAYLLDPPVALSGWRLVPTVSGNVATRPHVIGDGGAAIFYVEFLDEQSQPVSLPIGAQITARVEFIDSAGRTWSRHGLEQPRPIRALEP